MTLYIKLFASKSSLWAVWQSGFVSGPSATIAPSALSARACVNCLRPRRSPIHRRRRRMPLLLPPLLLRRQRCYDVTAFCASRGLLSAKLLLLLLLLRGAINALAQTSLSVLLVLSGENK